MKKLLAHSACRWITSLLAVVILTVAAFLFTNAAARPRAAIEPRLVVKEPTPQAPIYNNGSFTFAAPQQMPKSPLSPIFFQADAEPEIKADIYGNIYITAINGVPGGTDSWKSVDLGSTFTYLGQPDGLQDKCATPTPQCLAAGGADDSTDVSDGGYLYVASLYIGSVTHSTSMDGGAGGTAPGQAWVVNPVATGVPIEDRQWIAAYGPQTVNMTVRQAPGTGRLLFTKSTDAGRTFSVPILLTSADSTEGNLVVDKYTGYLYTTFIPSAALNRIDLLKSTDGGATWSTITGVYTGPVGADPAHKFTIVTVDRGGNLHLAFSSKDANGTHVYLTSSPFDSTVVNGKPKGAGEAGTWTTAFRVDNGANTNTAVMPWIVGGSPGTVDITWIGSGGADANTAPFNWNVFFAQVTNTLTASPAIAQNQVTTTPIHDTNICFLGSGCSGANNRDLLEYYTMTVDPSGNALIAYPDSVNNCDPATCKTNTWFTRQTAGPKAYTAVAGPGAAEFGANIPVGAPGSEPGLKVDSHNCIFVTAPGNPWVWKSVNNGVTFLPPVNPVADRVLTAGDEDILPVPQIGGARPDQLYFVDLATLTRINVAKSTDGGATWFPPGPGGAAGVVDASTDRQWIAYDRVPTAADLTVYEMDHEAASEEIRFNALTNDTSWSPPATGITAPELILPPDSTFPNTNPGPVFVDPATHMVYGVFCGSTVRTNEAQPPFGKLPNIWEAFGPPPAAAGAPPGPFTNAPVFKGVQDSPSGAPVTTFGSNTANDFPTAAIDAAGNIYVLWAMNNARTNEYMVWMATSHDHGQTFYGPIQVSQGPGAAVYPWIAAGDGDKINVVYYSTSTPVDPNVAPNTVQWNVMFAQSFNASAREPSFTISPVSHHAMHTGPICNMGILCPSGTRTLADFFQVAIGPDGLASVIYADNGPVPVPAGSPDRSVSGTHAEFARQVSGPLALANTTSPTCLPLSINPLSAVSRKTHGTQGVFDVDMPLTGPAGIEPRGSATGDYQLLVYFANPVTVGGGNLTGTGQISSITTDGPTVIVNLTAVTTPQKLTVNLTGVSDGTNPAGNVSVPMRICLGDTSNDGTDNSADATQVRSASGQLTSGSNFRMDVNADGVINSADVTLVRAHSGDTAPP